MDSAPLVGCPLPSPVTDAPDFCGSPSRRLERSERSRSTHTGGQAVTNSGRPVHLRSRRRLAARLARQRRGRRSCPHQHRIRTGLFEPKSPLRGNGIFRAETKRPKRPWRFKDAGAETKSRQATPPIRGESRGSGKSPLERECVVGLGGLELRAKHAVAIEPERTGIRAPLGRYCALISGAKGALTPMCGINAFGIAEIAKGLFGCAEQSKVVRSEFSQSRLVHSAITSPVQAAFAARSVAVI